MHHLLDRLLKKKGIKTVDQLTDEEKVVFDRWQGMLGDGEMTVAKIGDFCSNQIHLIESKWKELDNSQEKNQRLIMMHTVYKSILDLINKPKSEREALEKYLSSLLQ